MIEPITFRITATEATCQGCKEVIRAHPTLKNTFELSPHLRARYGFSGAAPDFETVSEVICPRMTIVRATDPTSAPEVRA